MTTMLQLVQQATGEMGLPVPTYVAGNPAQDQIQQLALLNAVGYELAREYDWNELCKEYRFSTQYTTTTGNITNGSAVVTGIPSTTGLDITYMVVGTGVNTDTYIQSVDSSSQVTLTQAVTTTATGSTLNFCKTKYNNPSDFDRPIDRTQWDKSKHWEMLGPESPQQWQWLKSGYISTGPRMRFRRMGGAFQIWPPITSAEYLGMEYVSTQWAINGPTNNRQSSFTTDTDTCIFPDRLMVLGLKSKYWQAKGFNDIFADDYEAQKSIAKASDGGSAILSFAPQVNQVLIGIANVPDTNYGS